MNDAPTMQLVSAMALGALSQRFLRAPGGVANLWSYAAFGAGALALWWWSTPGALSCFLTAHDPQAVGNCIRSIATGIVAWYLTARGSASASKDVGLSPPANSKP